NNIEWKAAIVAVLMTTALLVAYMVLRRAVGLSMETGGSTAVVVGMNMPRNVLQLFTASVTPASTVRIYEATVEHAWWSVAQLASGSMLVLAALVYGLLGPTWKHSIGNAAMF